MNNLYMKFTLCLEYRVSGGNFNGKYKKYFACYVYIE